MKAVVVRGFIEWRVMVPLRGADLEHAVFKRRTVFSCDTRREARALRDAYNNGATIEQLADLKSTHGR